MPVATRCLPAEVLEGVPRSAAWSQALLGWLAFVVGWFRIQVAPRWQPPSHLSRRQTPGSRKISAPLVLCSGTVTEVLRVCASPRVLYCVFHLKYETPACWLTIGTAVDYGSVGYQLHAFMRFLVLRWNRKPLRGDFLQPSKNNRAPSVRIFNCLHHVLQSSARLSSRPPFPLLGCKVRPNRVSL